MEYLLLIASDESDAPDYGSDGFDAWMAGWTEFSASLIASGHFIAGAGLQPSTTATTIRKKAGADAQIVDGPYAETKEQLGGFYVITAGDLDEALAVADSLPVPAGSVEVRPLAYRPDAAQRAQE